MSLPWHPRNHADALDGMLMLTLEERGAYNTVLDLIYSRSGPVPDDERWLAGWMGCSVRKWLVLRAALIVKGKLFTCEHLAQPSLMNERARIELDSALARRRAAAESGARGGRKTAETPPKPSKNNAEPQATVAGSPKLLTETSTEREEEPPTEPNGSAAPKGARARGSKLVPVAWSPSDATMLTLAAEGHEAGSMERALTMMRDHEFRTPRSDWDKTYRNWVREDAKRQPRKAHERSHPDQRATAYAERLGDIGAAMEAAVQQRRGSG